MTVEERAMNVMDKSRIKTLEDRSNSVIDHFRFRNEVMSEPLLVAKIMEALRDQIEDCAKVCDDETRRLDRLSMEYKQKGDLTTATRFSACTVTSARLGRIIRALAAPTEEKPDDDGVEDRFRPGGFWVE